MGLLKVALVLIAAGGLAVGFWALYQVREDDDEPSWNDLTPDQQRHWGALGWDSNRWDNNIPPPSASTDYNDLTPEQQKAVDALGYSPAQWNALE